MPYTSRTFDQILSDIITDFQNMFPGVDVSVGSVAGMKARGYASQIWALEQFQQWIAKQIFPDTADADELEHHAYTWAITRTYGETDAALLARLLDRIRKPPAGGNKYDYVKWAKEVDNVANAYCFPLVRGLGTVDLVILANAETTGSEIPSAELIAAVQAYIDDLRPVTAKNLYVRGPTTVATDVTMTLTGDSADPEAARADIEAYMAVMEPGQALTRAQLIAIGMTNGATNVVVTEPATDVAVAEHEMIRPGDVNVT